MQNFITWLILQYNLEVKVIPSDNIIDYIKTKEWCNNIVIFFELSAPDTHMQKDKSERLKKLIIEKACIIRLSANLLYQL